MRVSGRKYVTFVLLTCRSPLLSRLRKKLYSKETHASSGASSPVRYQFLDILCGSSVCCAGNFVKAMSPALLKPLLTLVLPTDFA